MRTLSSGSNGSLASTNGDRLILTPSWAREPVALMPAKAARELRSSDSSDELSVGAARWLFEGRAADDIHSVREFVTRAALGVPSQHRLSDAELRRFIVDRIEAGQLVAVRSPGPDDGANSQWRALRELVKNIELLTPGGLFRAHGRQYKLLVGVDLARLRDRDQYELASQEEARRILGEISQQNDVNRSLVPMLSDARGQISRDWRPPLEPDGLVLLRRKVTNRATRPNDIPVLTPSQMVPREEKSWIEIELVDEDGEPYVGDVELTLADGKKVRASSNAKGLLRLDGIKPGSCQVTLPDLDASSWAPK